jgi:hypothetical protein
MINKFKIYEYLENDASNYKIKDYIYHITTLEKYTQILKNRYLIPQNGISINNKKYNNRLYFTTSLIAAYDLSVNFNSYRDIEYNIILKLPSNIINNYNIDPLFKHGIYIDYKISVDNIIDIIYTDDLFNQFNDEDIELLYEYNYHDEDEDEENEYNPLEDINNIEIDNIVYHGSIRNINNDINDLSLGYSDWEAIWVTSEENIAKEFSDFPTADEVQIIYKIKLTIKDIADINNDLAIELIEYFGLSDIRELIPILTDYGYNGWKVTGAISRHIYDDIAIFYNNYLFDYTIKIIHNDNETKYISLQEANNYLEKIRY